MEMKSFMECHVNEDDYGIQIETTRPNHANHITIQTAEDVKIIRDACNKWLKLFAPELLKEEGSGI